jgi:hypothetical protein
MKITNIHGTKIEVAHPWLLRRLSDKWNAAAEKRIAEEGGDKEIKFGSLPGGDCYRPARVGWFACAINVRGHECDWEIVDSAEAARIAGAGHADGSFRVRGFMDIWRKYGDIDEQWEMIGHDPEAGFLIAHADLCYALKGEAAIRAEMDIEISEILRMEPRLADHDSTIAKFIGVEPAEKPEAFLNRKLLAAARIDKCRRVLAWLSYHEIEWLAVPVAK